MITETGCRIDSLCKSFKIETKLKEKIWETVKYIFSEKTEMIFGKHIAVIILCSIFAETKITFPIKFNSLIQEYCNLFEDEERIFISLKLRNGETANLIDYYNKEFIEIMKPYIEDRIHPIKPRVAILSPSTTLKVQINGASPSKKSPFLNERSKCLITSSNKFSLEKNDSQKLPKLIKMLLLENSIEVIPMPLLRKN